MTLNAIVFMALILYVIWMAVTEHRAERASAATLTSDQRRAFDGTYALWRENADYPAELRAHAAVAQRARIRKGAACVILAFVLVYFLLKGL